MSYTDPKGNKRFWPDEDPTDWQDGPDFWKTQPVGKFWWCVGFYAAKHPDERRGQSTFNVLAALRPDLSEQIRATDLDAFDCDDLLTAMCQWIEANW